MLTIPDDSCLIISRFDKKHDPIVVSIPLEMSIERKNTTMFENKIKNLQLSKEDEDPYVFIKPQENRANTLYDVMHEFDSILETMKENMVCLFVNSTHFLAITSERTSVFIIGN